MNKKYLSVIPYSLFIIPALVFGAFDRDLTLGSRGADVEGLQNFLTEQGVYSGPVTGYFGNLTQEGVKKFQTQNGISPVFGYFGPLTRAAANSKASDSLVLSEAEATVSTLQTANEQKIAELQKLLQSLMSQLAALQAAQEVPTAPTPVVPELATTTPPVATTTTPEVTQALPNPFVSEMTVISDYPSRTLSSYTNAILNEYRFSSVPEKLAITRLRLTNSGTFSEIYFNSINLINSFTGEILAALNAPVNGVAEFVLVPDPAKTNKGLMVSGGTYAIMADLRTPSYGGTKPFIRLNIASTSDMTIVDYDTLTRTANISGSNTFEIIGPQISAF